MCEAGISHITGTDVDELAVRIAQVAAPGAQVQVGDALAPGPKVDVVCGNPPFVPPERQNKALRQRLRRRYPWLSGRFDLAVQFAAAATERVRKGGAIGLVLPAPMLVQKYGAPLRRRWVQHHRVAALEGPHPFPGAAVQVTLVVLGVGQAAGPVPCHGVSPHDVLALPNAPLDGNLRPGDVEIVSAVRAQSVMLGELATVDTGVVCHGAHGGKARLLFDQPGEGRVPYADARDFFANRSRWLEYSPDIMHRAKSPALFEPAKIVIQRLRGKGAVRARIDRTGMVVGHTCTVVVPHDVRVSLDDLLDLVRSTEVDQLIRIERGERLDLYPRDVASIPVPRAWLTGHAMPLREAWGLDEAQATRLGAKLV
jgi:hypothetical protein